MRDRPSSSDRHKAPGAKSGQITHHRNEDKADGSSANLEAKDRGKHTAEHNRARPLSKLRASLRMFKEGKKAY